MLLKPRLDFHASHREVADPNGVGMIGDGARKLDGRNGRKRERGGGTMCRARSAKSGPGRAGRSS